MMRRLTGLVRLYPRAWRRRYGAGLEALLDDMPVTPAVVLDVARGAAGAHVQQRRSAVVWLVAAVATMTAEALSFRAGVTVNVLWAPTDPRRALFLLLTLTPAATALWLTVPLARAAARTP
jgi:hypothetical protein